MARLAGKVTLVTGGARGMGAAICRLFAKEGARVWVADVLDAECEALAKEIGEAARALRLDVRREEDWERAREVLDEAGPGLDVLVNNAGVAHQAPLVDYALEDYRAVLDVNQVGVFLGMRTAARMMQGRGGSIVNIGSTQGITGMNDVIAYVSSKFAVTGMTRAAALELGEEGIRVNTIHPGYTNTSMTNPEGAETSPMAAFVEATVPLARMGEPEDVARMALFLASDESAYSSGGSFSVDGGALAGWRVPTESRPPPT